MGKCKECETEIEDKYEVCLACLKKRQAKTKQENGKDLLKALSAINNNLYAIRRHLELNTAIKYKKVIQWDRKIKDFVEKDIE